MQPIDPQKLASEVQQALLAIGIEAKVTSKLEQVVYGTINGHNDLTQYPWIRLFVDFDQRQIDVHNPALPHYWHPESVARSLRWVVEHDHELPLYGGPRDDDDQQSVTIEHDVENMRFRQRGVRVTRVHHRVALAL